MSLPGPMTSLARHPALQALLVVACAGAASFALLGPPFWHTNDDAVMSTVVAGVGWIGGERHPAEQAIFIHLLLGKALVAAYRAAPGVPWYGLMLLAALAAAVAACAYAGLRLRPEPRARALVLLFAALACGLGYSTLHFGVTASLLAGGALLLGLSLAVRPADDARRTTALAVSAGALLLFGFLLRPAGAALGLLAGAPLGVIVLRRRPRRALWACAAGLIACLACHALLRAWEMRAYAREPGWSEALDWMDAKLQFIDHARIAYTDEARPVFAAAGWSANDLELLRRWFAWDPQLYGAASLRAMEARLRQAGAMPAHNFAPERMRSALVTPLSLAALALALALAWTGTRREGVELLLAFACQAALLLGVGAFLRTPPLRVHLPAWLLACAVPVFALVLREAESEHVRPRAPRRRRALLGALGTLVTVLAVEAGGAHDVAARRAHWSAAARRDLARFEALAGDPLLLNWAGLFPVHDLVRPLEPFEGDSGAARYAASSFFWIGWPVRLPINALGLERRGARDLYAALVERDDLVLLTRPLHLPVLERALLERRGLHATHRLLLVGETVAAYRLVRADPSPAESR